MKTKQTPFQSIVANAAETARWSTTDAVRYTKPEGITDDTTFYCVVSPDSCEYKLTCYLAGDIPQGEEVVWFGRRADIPKVWV